MRRPRTRLCLLAATLAVCAAVPAAAPTVARGQSLFLERDVLRGDSALELAVSALEESTESTVGTTTFADVESSQGRLGGRVRFKVLGGGASAEQRRYAERTETYDLRDDRDRTTAFVSLENPITDNQALFLVLGTGALHEEFAYDAYLRRLDSLETQQAGVIYRLNFLILGYRAGKKELRLRVDEGGTSIVDETYEYDYNATLAGLELGDPAEGGLRLLVQRKKTPPVPGTAVDLEEGFEEVRQATLVLLPLEVDYERTLSRDAFSGDSLRETIDRDVTISLYLNDAVTIGASQRRTESRHDFVLAGVPSSSTSARTESLLTFRWRF